MKKSTISCLDSGLIFFAARKIGKREVVGYYNRSLLYLHLTEELHQTKSSEDQVMLVTAESF